MMFFVCKQHQEYGRTYENNVRLGGFKTMKGACNAALKHAPALVRDETRKVVKQSVNKAMPFYVA